MRSFSPSAVLAPLAAVAIGVAAAMWAISLHSPRAATEELAADLRATAIPLKSHEPRSGFDDLAPLRAIIGDARIVGLGQGTLGTHEFDRMRHRLVEYLVEDMGFTSIVIQANMQECEALNRYVRGGEGNVEQLLDNLYHWMWHTEEMLDLVGWVRAYNSRNGPVLSFRGIDMADDGVAVHELAQFFNLYDPDFSFTADSLTDVIASASRDFGRDPSAIDARAVRDHLLASEAMQARIESRAAEFEEIAPADDLLAARINARIQSQHARAYSKPQFPASSNYHSSAMADNIEWLLGLEPPGTKMIVWSTNVELDRTGWYFTPLGRHLADRHGDRYVSIGFATGTGSYTGRDDYELGAYELAPPPEGSLERQLAMVGLPRFAVDLRRARAEQSPLLGEWLFRSIGAMTYGNGFYSAPVAEMFDVLIYIDATMATRVIGGIEAG